MSRAQNENSQRSALNWSGVNSAIKLFRWDSGSPASLKAGELLLEEGNDIFTSHGRCRPFTALA